MRVALDEFLSPCPVCILSSNALSEYIFNLNVSTIMTILVEVIKREQLVLILQEKEKDAIKD